jgi:membrane protease YdiL (CAAX protease family)
VLGLPFRGFFASAFGAEAIPTGSLILTLVTLVLVNFFLRGIGEETGWRGFAASLAGNKRHPILALLLVGGLWALWHIHPANFASILTLSGLFLLLNIAATSIILAWTYLRTESLFLAAVFHMTLNVAEWIMPTGLLNDFHLSRALTQTVLIWLVAVGLLINLAQHPIKETC